MPVFILVSVTSSEKQSYEFLQYYSPLLISELSKEKHNWKSGRNCLKETVHACSKEFELNCLIDFFNAN